MKKTPNEIKDAYAIKHGYDDWLTFRFKNSPEKILTIDFDAILELFATQYHSEKLDEVAGELPSDGIIEEDLRSSFIKKSATLLLAKIKEEKRLLAESALEITVKLNEGIKSQAGEIKEYETLLANKQKEAEDDAVGFLEWIIDNEYIPNGKNNEFYKIENREKIYTTSELYKKYKSETK